MSSMKLINYRGGIARFYLPSSWVEEYDQEGRGTFYEDKPDASTFRISVMGIMDDCGRPQTVDSVIAQISGAESVERLPGGIAIAQSSELANENGNELLIYTWYIGVPLAPARFRIVIFTYSILAAHESEPYALREIAMLNRSIAEGEYPAAGAIEKIL